MKRRLANSSSNTSITKKVKRSQIARSKIPLPQDALDNIHQLFITLHEKEEERERVLGTSYSSDDPQALALLATYGFVKFKTAPEHHGSLQTFYQNIKKVLDDAYRLDVTSESAITESRKNKNDRLWPRTLNIGKIGPVHFQLPSDPVGGENLMHELMGTTRDPITQSVLAYSIKAHLCYNIFKMLLKEEHLLASVEPITMVLSPISTQETPALLTRLLYNPGVLTKDVDGGDSQSPDEEDNSSPSPPGINVDQDSSFEVLQTNPYCGILAITEGDSISLVPGAHTGFSDMLQYMREIRHTDKRTRIPSAPPDEFELDQWLVSVPLQSGELLVYDRKIPTKIKPMMKNRKPTFENRPIEPFVALPVSFFPSSSLSPGDVGVRSLAFLFRRFGSSLRVFGHVENPQRRGVPVVVDETRVTLSGGNTKRDQDWMYRSTTTEDPLVRRIIGLDGWK